VEGAARLIGAAEAWVGDFGDDGGGQDPRLALAAASTRSALGDAAFAAARAEGAGFARGAAFAAARALLADIAAGASSVEAARGIDVAAATSRSPHPTFRRDIRPLAAGPPPIPMPSGVLPTPGAAAVLPPLPAVAIDLTRREQEILDLLSQRLSNQEIADQLYIGARTVEFHVANIIGKLGAENRREAAAIAARMGLV
jgi:DNA-binding CsgD family transcriptional regulator